MIFALVLLLALEDGAPPADAVVDAAASDAAPKDAAPKEAVPPPPVDPLGLARAALEARDPSCDKRALEALQSGALDEAGAAEAWSLRARCALLAADGDRATRAFAAALRIDADTASVDDDSFRRAVAERLPRSLSFEATFDGEVLAFALLGDDLQLAKSAALVGEDGERARVPLEVGHATHRVSGVDVQGGEARLCDRWGNTIARAPIGAAVPAVSARVGAATGAQSAGPGAVTYVGAGLVGVGILGLTVSGVGTAIAGKDVLDEAPLWVGGLVAGGALFLTGAGLVVVDQGIP